MEEEQRSPGGGCRVIPPGSTATNTTPRKLQVGLCRPDMLPGAGGGAGGVVDSSSSINTKDTSNDIVISHDLLMELTFIPPTAIDLQFHPGYPKTLQRQLPTPQGMQSQQTNPPPPQGSNSGPNAGSRRLSTHCLTGRPYHRTYPATVALSASAESLPRGYEPQHRGYEPLPRGYMDQECLVASRAGFHHHQQPIDSFPRLAREGRKPLQRFAPMLSVPPPQSTAFIEARRRQLRQLMETCSGRPPPNTPELTASRASSTLLVSSQEVGPLSARSSRSARSSPSSRPAHLVPPRTSACTLRLTQQRALHAAAKAQDVKPIVLRMRTRADEGFKTTAGEGGEGGGGGGETSRASKDSREGLLPMAHIAPKMLVHQWLEVGTDGAQPCHRELTHIATTKPSEKVALRTQQQFLGDITARRNTP